MLTAVDGVERERVRKKQEKRLVIRLWDYVSTLYSEILRGGGGGGGGVSLFFIYIIGVDYRCKLKSARIKGQVSSLICSRSCSRVVSSSQVALRKDWFAMAKRQCRLEVFPCASNAISDSTEF